MLTASLISTSSSARLKQKGNAILRVTPGLPTNLEVTDGNNQNIVINTISEPMAFKLADMYGNSITGKIVNFSVKDPVGDSTVVGLTPISATTDDDGKVETQYTATQITGIYTVTATLANNPEVLGNTRVAVTESLPTIPSLGAARAINSNGQLVDVNATFAGGISVNQGDFVTKVTQNLSSDVIVKGVITPDTNHINKQVDIIVIAGYRPPASNDKELFYMLDEQMNILQWDMNIASLTALQQDTTLHNPHEIIMHSGKFVADGTLSVFFGYRLSDSGIIVFNAESPIEIEIME